MLSIRKNCIRHPALTKITGNLQTLAISYSLDQGMETYTIVAHAMQIIHAEHPGQANIAVLLYYIRAWHTLFARHSLSHQTSAWKVW